MFLLLGMDHAVKELRIGCELLTRRLPSSSRSKSFECLENNDHQKNAEPSHHEDGHECSESDRNLHALTVTVVSQLGPTSVTNVQIRAAP